MHTPMHLAALRHPAWPIWQGAGACTTGWPVAPPLCVLLLRCVNRHNGKMAGQHCAPQCRLTCSLAQSWRALPSFWAVALHLSLGCMLHCSAPFVIPFPVLGS